MCDQCREAPFGHCKCGCGRPVGKHGCTSHSKRTKVLCGGRAIRGRCVCRTHGGTIKRGVSHHNFKTGLHSLQMPARVAALVEAEKQDPNRLSNLREIELLGARSREILAQLDDAGSRQAIKEAGKQLANAEQAFNEGNPPAVQRSLEAIGECLDRCREDYRLWDELMVVWRERRDAIESESRNNYRKGQAVSGDELAHIVGVILLTLRDYLPDREQLHEFTLELERKVPSVFATAGTLAKERSKTEADGDDD